MALCRPRPDFIHKMLNSIKLMLNNEEKTKQKTIVIEFMVIITCNQSLEILS